MSKDTQYHCQACGISGATRYGSNLLRGFFVPVPGTRHEDQVREDFLLTLCDECALRGNARMERMIHDLYVKRKD